jgi:hypothetical protein
MIASTVGIGFLYSFKNYSHGLLKIIYIFNQIILYNAIIMERTLVKAINRL